MKKYDYLIVGAGLTGATVAQVLTECGKHCLVLEKRDQFAGNAYDVEIDGILVHRYGAHIFHTSNQRVWNYLNRFTTFRSYVHSPVANYCGEIYNLPFNMNTFSRLWNISTPAEAMAELQRQRIDYGHVPENAEEQALSLAGQDIYEKLIRGYTEKQWGRSCKELPAFILRRIPFRFRYDNNYFDDAYQGLPDEGYTRLVEKLLDGVEVRLGVDYLKEREAYDALADTVVYTGMIDAFFDHCEGHLAYRTLRFENEQLNSANYQGAAVMNYTDRETPFTRIIEHKHFSKGVQPNTIISREYPAEWKPGREPYYPINDKQNMGLLAKYQKMAGMLKKVYFCGRLAEYKYCDMDEAVASALALAEHLTGR